MVEHFTRNTETATAWCAKCGRSTEHRVDGGKIGPCLDANHPAPIPRAVIPKLDLPKEPEQQNLFTNHESRDTDHGK
jgi:hypothetical protein